MGAHLATAVRFWNGEKDTVPPIVYREARAFFRGQSVDYEDYKIGYNHLLTRLAKSMGVSKEVAERFVEHSREP